jgi:hypothetical protein
MPEVTAPIVPVQAPGTAAPKNGAAPKAPVKPVEPPKPVEVTADAPEPTDTYVIDGKEVQLTRTQAKHWVEKSAASDKRFQEASKMRKEVETLFEAFSTSGLKVLEHKYGKEAVKAQVQKYLQEEEALAAMTPEQKRIKQLEDEKAEAESKLKETEEAKRTEAQRRLDTQQTEALEQQFVTAAKKYNLPQDAVTLELMTDIAIEAIEMGVTHVTAEQVAQETMRRLDEARSHRDQKRSKTLQGKALLEYLGSETVAEVLKASLETGPVSAADKAKAAAKPKADEPVKRSGKGYTSEVEFEKRVGLRK